MSGRPRKLTPEQVKEVREWWERRMAIPTPKEMSLRFGVARETLRKAALYYYHKRVR